MRDFNFKDDNIAVGQPLNELPQTPRVDETILQNESEPMRPFHVAASDEDSSNNTAKIVGGIVAGALLIGGSLYAYETFSTRAPAPQTVAMNAPTPNNAAMAPPANPPAIAPPATATDTTAAPSQTSPDGISPTPSRRAHSSNGTSAPPAASSADAAVNAPMTLTPQTAPPPEQSGSSGQTALQQPVSAPAVAGETTQPTPEVANNAAAGDNTPSDAAQAPTAPAQAEDSQNGLTTQPAMPAQ
ncbi:MAG TPA: hypothetical protein VNW15_02855 [Rhizomicrobium sp.]|jgi:hypothetical protein|nr:hypothetical protein [Rhizomicrobium sp.]